MRKTRWTVALMIGATLGACGQAAAPSGSAAPSATAVKSPQPTDAVTSTMSATAGATPSADDDASTVWSAAASQTSSATVVDMTFGDDGFVAVGSERDESRTGNPLFGRTWISGDGTSWELLPPDGTFDRAYLTDVVSTSDGAYLVFGRIEDAAGSRDEVPLATWESADGRRWQRIDPSMPAELSSVQVAAGAKGYLASAFAPGGHQLWHSVDARNWQLVRQLPPITNDHYEDIQRIAAGDDGFVAVGTRESARYVIASADGRDWFEGPSNPDLSLDFAAVGGEWVMTGYPAEVGVLPILFSMNGLDWQRSAPLEVPSAEDLYHAIGLVSTGPAVFVGLGIPGPHPGILPRGLWSSRDGTAWTGVEVASDAILAAAATSGDVQALAGNTGEGAVFFVRSEEE